MREKMMHDETGWNWILCVRFMEEIFSCVWTSLALEVEYFWVQVHKWADLVKGSVGNVNTLHCF